MADRDDDDRCARGPSLGRLRLGDRSQERERFEIDPDELDAGLLAGLDIAIEQVAIGDDEQDAPRDASLLVLPFIEDLPVDHSLLDRDRQRLVGAEANCILELLDIVDAAEVERPNADAVVRDP